MTQSTARLAATGLTPTTVLWFTAGLSMLQPLATDLYLPTLPGIAAYFETSVVTVQWTLSVFVAAFGAWQLVAGPVSDRYGRYPVIVAGALIYCGASVLAMLAPSIGVLIAARLLQAVGACSCLVGARALVRDLYSPAEGARLLAGASTIMSLAPLIGPVLGAYLYLAFGWRSAFALLAGFSLFLAAAAALKLKETNLHRNPLALRIAPMLRTYADVSRSPAFRAYALAASATYAGLFAFISGSSFVLIRVLGVSTTAYGFSFSTMVAGYLVGTLVCRRLVALHGMQRTIYAGASLQAAAGAALALLAAIGAHVPAAIVVPMFFYGVAHGMIQPPAQSGAVAPFPRAAGAAAALLGFTMMSIASLVGFWIGASFNGTVYPLTLTICATSFSSAAIAFTLVRRHGDVAHHG
jgi:DHA1 family bicyclomycin/chloramphenicol resistance-like MFS transporter